MTEPQMRVMLQIEYGQGLARSMVNLGAAATATPAMIGFTLGQQIDALRALAIERSGHLVDGTLES